MRLLLAVMVLAGTLFAAGCGNDCGTTACLPPPPPRPMATVYSPPPVAPPVQNTDVAYCNPCAGF